MRVIQHCSESSRPPAAVTSIAELPLVLTVEEAARVLRISRAAAYEQARIWRETGGRDGLPVIAVGRSLRVPRAAPQEKLRCPSPAEAATGAGAAL
ncbi:MAG: helix-turn-helix domain-containing protein [Actinomycetota bacterium]|nr:helix-turn-helix domain-containing protein [Actinomycetota bacterium]